MKARDFACHSEVPLSREDSAEALSYVAIIKNMLVAHGFARPAVEGLRFDVRAYTLKVTEDEKKRGAWHRYDGGVPFFEVGISTAATMDDLAIGNGRLDPRSLPVEAQTAHLLVDLASDCFAGVEKLARRFGNAAALPADTGRTIDFPLDTRNGLSVHITTRRPLDEFFGMAADRMIMRLKSSGLQASAKPPRNGTGAPPPR